MSLQDGYDEQPEVREDPQGEVARVAREHIPATWAALLARPNFGQSALEGRVAAVKARLFGVVTDPSDELVVHGPSVCEYAGVVVALELVGPGYDHWMSQASQVSASGNRNENKTYFEGRAAAILVARDKILLPLERSLYPQVSDQILTTAKKRQGSVPTARRPRVSEHQTADPSLLDNAFELPRSG